jgi:hypothetical protein
MTTRKDHCDCEAGFGYRSMTEEPPAKKVDDDTVSRDALFVMTWMLLFFMTLIIVMFSRREMETELTNQKLNQDLLKDQIVTLQQMIKEHEVFKDEIYTLNKMRAKNFRSLENHVHLEIQAMQQECANVIADRLLDELESVKDDMDWDGVY